MPSTRRTMPTETVSQGLALPTEPMSGKVWQRVPGCAHAIAAGAPDQVVVTGCDDDGTGARSIWFWRSTGASGHFVPESPDARMARSGGSPLDRQITRLPALARSLSVDAVAGRVYAIGPDGRLYWRQVKEPSDHVWHAFIGTRSGYEPQMTVASVAAGGGLSTELLWVVSTQPGGPGGNRIFHTVPCALADNRSSGRCWHPFVGSALQVALAHRVAWVVSADGSIFQRQAEGWRQVPGCARALAGNGDHLVVTGCENGADGAPKIYRYANDRFLPLAMTGRSLAVDVAGTLWVVKPNGEIWRQRASSSSTPR